MITIISGTNRINNNSIKVARKYAERLTIKGIENQIFDLTALPASFLTSDMYGNRSMEMMDLIERYIDSTNHFVFILPEYNGSFSGVVKLLLDGIEPSYFHNKFASLVGLSSGRAGNIRGMDAFGNVLNYLQMEVLSKKVKLSGIENLLDDVKDNLVDEQSIKMIDSQIERMLNTQKVAINQI